MWVAAFIEDGLISKLTSEEICYTCIFLANVEMIYIATAAHKRSISVEDTFLARVGFVRRPLSVCRLVAVCPLPCFHFV